MTVVKWDDDVPAAVRSSFEPHLLHWFAFVPAWCQEVLMNWNSESSGADCETHIHYEYRWFRIVIFPTWLEASTERQSSIVLHEILHASLIPILATSGDLLDFVKEKYPDVFPWAKEMRRAGMEATICDLTDSIMRHLSRPA